MILSIATKTRTGEK